MFELRWALASGKSALDTGEADDVASPPCTRPIASASTVAPLDPPDERGAQVHIWTLDGRSHDWEALWACVLTIPTEQWPVA